MILLEPSLKSVQDSDITVNAATFPNDPPPAYVDSTAPVASGSGSGPGAQTTGPRPANFLSLIRTNGGPIKGSYTIDPRVRIPPALLPEATEPRRNVYLETTSAPIDVDIFVVGDATSSKVDIQLESGYGYITARIHAASSGPRSPIHITARSDGPVTIALPHGFRGPLTVRTYNSAPRLPAEATIFSEVRDTRRGFVGDFSDWTDGEVGDALSAESAKGRVTVRGEGESGDRDWSGLPGETWDPTSESWMRLVPNMHAAQQQIGHHLHHPLFPPGPHPSHPLGPHPLHPPGPHLSHPLHARGGMGGFANAWPHLSPGPGTLSRRFRVRSPGATTPTSSVPGLGTPWGQGPEPGGNEANYSPSTGMGLAAHAVRLANQGMPQAWLRVNQHLNDNAADAPRQHSNDTDELHAGLVQAGFRRDENEDDVLGGGRRRRSPVQSGLVGIGAYDRQSSRHHRTQHSNDRAADAQRQRSNDTQDPRDLFRRAGLVQAGFRRAEDEDDVLGTGTDGRRNQNSDPVEKDDDGIMKELNFLFGPEAGTVGRQNQDGDPVGKDDDGIMKELNLLFGSNAKVSG
ncbi:hypothetical protein MVEN_00256100 [Mycena venus]|uniref:DUF7330 domain-containing protein n=1 Tax=Mycena venus TaxID=2733690 RepID=A0A8H7DEK3_9AGAR|nr:hypothetical protein MVEN_00256100 [Mycena venus]